MNNTLPNRSEIASRIKFLIKSMRLTQGGFARRLGINPANLSKALNTESALTMGLVNRISADMGVSKEWLCTGQGVPYDKESDREPREVVAESALTVSAPQSATGVPVYDIDVTAGRRELSLELTDDRIIGRINLPNISEDAAIVRVSGDSMDPTVRNGSYVAIRPVSNTTYIFWGQIYVIVLDDYRMVKFVKRNPDNRKVTLHSDNPSYDDMEVNRDDIRRLYLVEAVINCDLRC